MTLRDTAAAGISALVVTLFLIFTFDGWLRGLSIDVLFWLHQKTVLEDKRTDPAPVAVIAIDEETFRRAPFNGVPKVLWTKEIAKVLDSVVEGGAAVVGFDVIFSTSIEKHVRGFDRDFLLALRHASTKGKVVLAKVQHQLKPIQPYPGYSYAVGHEKNIRAANLFTDEDGIIRSAPLWLKKREGASSVRSESSFALEIASRALKRKPRFKDNGRVALGDYEIPGLAPGRVLLNFDGRAQAIPTYSLADMFACAKAGRPHFFREAFAGKTVLIGGVLDVEDRKLTSARLITRPEADNRGARCALPLMEGIYRADLRRDTLPGVYVQATAVANLIQRQPLSEIAPAARAAITVLLAILTFIAVLVSSPLTVGIGLILGGAAWAGTSTAIFSQGVVIPLFLPLVGAILTVPVAFGYRFMITDRDKRYLRRAFSYYLSPPLVERLIESEETPRLGGETKYLTAFFSDLEGFTGLSEKRSPSELVAFLNVYLSGISNIIEEKGGIIERFIADGVAAVFGAPLPDSEHALHAVEAALEISARIQTVELTEGSTQAVRTRIGINSGEMLVGNIGSQRRLNYSVMGDAANLASRLEGANKLFGTSILVSEETASLCRDHITFREVDRVRVVGRVSPVTIFEPIGLRDEVRGEKNTALSRFADGLALYRKRELHEARQVFGELAATDPVAQVFLQRIEALERFSLPDSWDGTFDLTEK